MAKKPYIFVIFQGGPDPLPRLWIHTWICSTRSFENAIKRSRSAEFWWSQIIRILLYTATYVASSIHTVFHPHRYSESHQQLTHKAVYITWPFQMFTIIHRGLAKPQKLDLLSTDKWWVKYPIKSPSFWVHIQMAPFLLWNFEYFTNCRPR